MLRHYYPAVPSGRSGAWKPAVIFYEGQLAQAGVKY